MADLLPMVKRWAFLWPVLVAALALIGFKWMSPNSRLEAVEQAQAQVPALVQEAIDSQVRPLRAAIAAQQSRDSATQAQLLWLSRTVAVGVALQCRDLPARDREFLRAAVQVCDQTSRSSGIPYQRP